MSRMILSCGACGTQNFVGAERLAVAGVPPRCWKCGEALPLSGETDSDKPESKQGNGAGTTSGEERNA